MLRIQVATYASDSAGSTSGKDDWLVTSTGADGRISLDFRLSYNKKQEFNNGFKEIFKDALKELKFNLPDSTFGANSGKDVDRGDFETSRGQPSSYNTSTTFGLSKNPKSGWKIQIGTNTKGLINSLKLYNDSALSTKYTNTYFKDWSEEVITRKYSYPWKGGIWGFAEALAGGGESSWDVESRNAPAFNELPFTSRGTLMNSLKYSKHAKNPLKIFQDYVNNASETFLIGLENQRSAGHKINYGRFG